MDIKWGTEGSWYFLAIQNEIADTFLANTHHYIQLHDHSFYLHILHFYSYNVFSFSIKAVKVVDDEVQGFHDKMHITWWATMLLGEEMLYSKMMLKCCTFGSMDKMHSLCKLCEF